MSPRPRHRLTRSSNAPLLALLCGALLSCAGPSQHLRVGEQELPPAPTLASLMLLPTEPGNACEAYVTLTALEDQPSPFPALGVKLDTPVSGTDEEKATLAALATDPEVVARLDRFKQGATKAQCRVRGTLHPWPVTGDVEAWFDGPTLDYGPIASHAAVAMQVARDRNAAGQLDEAVEMLQVLMVVSWHLQQDNALIANLVGVALGAQVSDELAVVLAAGGESGGSRSWGAYARYLESRRDRQWLGGLKVLISPGGPSWSERVDGLAKMADDPGYLPGFRTEAAVALGAVHFLEPGPPPPSDKQLERMSAWRGSDDPVLREAAVFTEAFLTLDPAARSVQGERVRDMVERAKVK